MINNSMLIVMIVFLHCYDLNPEPFYFFTQLNELSITFNDNNKYKIGMF